jgi:4-azaleucine resistance transporter AzlC
MNSTSDFVTGVRDVSPLLLGFVPFGLITGITAVGIGLSAVEAVAMSAIMFSGAAQLATIELMAQPAPVAVIVATALMINLRFSMFSAAVAPHLRSLPHPWKAVSGFLLSTPSFVLSTSAFENDDSLSRRWYYLGTALPIWVVWVISTAVGVGVGARVPPELQLDFVIPLVFIVLLFKLLEDRATWIAAGVAGPLAVVGELAPLNLGLIAASLSGMAVGLYADLRWFS